MNLSQALSLRAMRAVLEEDGEYQYRAIFRWYSRTFHTPLHIVDDLPQEDVLTAYYETIFSELSEEDRKRQIAKLLEDESQASRRERLEEVGDVEFLKEATKEAENKEKAKKEAEEREVKKLEDLIESPEKPPFPVIPEEEPEIKVSYDSHNLKEEDLDDIPPYAPLEQ